MEEGGREGGREEGREGEREGERDCTPYQLVSAAVQVRWAGPSFPAEEILFSEDVSPTHDPHCRMTCLVAEI